MQPAELIIIPTYFYPSYGGLQNFTTRLARAMKDENVPVSILALYPTREIHVNPMPSDLDVVVLSERDRVGFWSEVYATVASRKGVRSCLAIGLELGEAVDAQLRCLRDLVRRGVRVCLRVATSGDLRQSVNRGNSEYLRELDYIVLLNRQMIEELRECVPGFSRFGTVPVIAEMSRYRPASIRERRRQRTAMGLAHDEWVCVWVGRLHADKRTEIAVDAWCAAGLEGTLLIVGSDESPGESYLKMLRAKASAHHDARVLFVPARPEHQMSDVYAVGDCLMCSSAREGMCNTVVEALCSGLRVVACDIPGTRVIKELVPGAPLRLSSGLEAQGLVDGLRWAYYDRLENPAGVQDGYEKVFGGRVVGNLFRSILRV